MQCWNFLLFGCKHGTRLRGQPTQSLQGPTWSQISRPPLTGTQHRCGLRDACRPEASGLTTFYKRPPWSVESKLRGVRSIRWLPVSTHMPRPPLFNRCPLFHTKISGTLCACSWRNAGIEGPALARQLKRAPPLLWFEHELMSTMVGPAWGTPICSPWHG